MTEIWATTTSAPRRGRRPVSVRGRGSTSEAVSESMFDSQTRGGGGSTRHFGGCSSQVLQCETSCHPLNGRETMKERKEQFTGVSKSRPYIGVSKGIDHNSWKPLGIFTPLRQALRLFHHRSPSPRGKPPTALFVHPYMSFLPPLPGGIYDDICQKTASLSVKFIRLTCPFEPRLGSF